MPLTNEAVIVPIGLRIVEFIDSL
ncbi:MAG: hypothetical protein R2784_14260 [Saprospiraceae bacterium]